MRKILVRVAIGVVIFWIAVAVVGRFVNTSTTLPPAPQGPGWVTWDGVTWQCNQVNTWFAHYGAYEPDGAPIPYEVVNLCNIN